MVSTLSQRSCFERAGDERAAALLGLDDAVAGQQIDRLADGDAGDAELGGQFLVRGQPQALRPYSARDPLPEDIGDLRVFRNVTVGNQIHLTSHPKPVDAAIYDITRAAPLSPIIRLVALVLAEVICGMTEASITRSLSTPRTRNCGSSTDAVVAAHPAGADAVKHRAAGGAREIPQAGIGCRPPRPAPSRYPRDRGTISAGRSRAASAGRRRSSCGRSPRQNNSARCAAARTDRSSGSQAVRATCAWHCQTDAVKPE